MTVEELWYSSYRTVRKHGGGEERVPPTAARSVRRSKQEQWRMGIDLAIEIATGEAGWRHARIARTRERYWYFRGGWWLIHDRIERRANMLRDAAMETEARRSRSKGSGSLDMRDVAARLRTWRDNGHWRRVAARPRSLSQNA